MSDPEIKPIPVNRWPLVLWVAAAFALTFYLLQPILLPFVLGALLAYFGDPIADYLESRGMSRTSAVVIVFLVLTGLTFLAALFAVPLLLHQLDALVQKIPEVYRWMTSVAGPWLQDRLDIPEASLPQIDWSSQLVNNWQSVGKLTAGTIRQITGSGAQLLLVLTNLALVPVVAFYLLRDWDRLMDKLLHMLPRAWQENVALIAGEADEVVSAFVRGQLLVMAALGVLYSLGLWLVGVQLARPAISPSSNAS